MGKEQAQGKGGGSSTTVAAAAATAPGRQTEGEDHDGDAGGDVGAATAQFRVPGYPVTFNMPGAAPRKRVDLTLHAPDHVSDAIDKFRIALDAGNKADAEYAWMFASPKDKLAFGASSTIDRDLVQMVHVIGPMTIHVMADAGLTFDGRGDLIELMLKVGMPLWFDSLALHGGGLLMSFLDHLPTHGQIDNAGLRKLDRIMKGTSSLALARPLFQRIYVPLADTTYNAKRVRTTPWTADYIHRLYDVLSTHLPVAHVRTVKAFHLATEEYKGGEWKKAKHAWWSPDGYVVLPVKNAKDGGTMDHQMTGGGHAQMDPGTGKGAKEGAINKFDVGALHEVGHAVGDAFGLHDLAKQNASVDFKITMSPADWSKGLWGDDAALTARASSKVHHRMITSHDARVYIAESFICNPKPPTGWEDPEKFEAELEKQYGDQPLTKYWQKWGHVDAKEDSYQFSGTANYGKDGRVYVYLTRGGSQLSSYKQEAHQKKVSWYSLASPHEWWAEQYAHFYRTGKTGAGLDGATAKKLAEIDNQEPPKTAAPAAGAATPAEDYDGESEAQRRPPFPW